MIIDGHADTLSKIASSGESLIANKCQFDLLRALKAGITLQVLALYTAAEESDSGWAEIRQQISCFKSELGQADSLAYQVCSQEELTKVGTLPRVGLLLHLEGGDALGRDPGRLDYLYHQGVRSIGLTWNNRNLIASGINDAEGSGLTQYGRSVVKRINQMGMMIDLSHINRRSFFDVFEASISPPYVSHANSHHIFPHPRNLKDDQLRMIRDAGSVVGVTFVPGFIGHERVTTEDLINHVIYIAELIGVEHVVFGSDFDGTRAPIVEDVGAYPSLIDKLRNRGFGAGEIEMISYRNFFKYLSQSLS